MEKPTTTLLRFEYRLDQEVDFAPVLDVLIAHLNAAGRHQSVWGKTKATLEPTFLVLIGEL
jgi:hypothetical protein